MADFFNDKDVKIFKETIEDVIKDNDIDIVSMQNWYRHYDKADKEKDFPSIRFSIILETKNRTLTKTLIDKIEHDMVLFLEPLKKGIEVFVTINKDTYKILVDIEKKEDDDTIIIPNDEEDEDAIKLYNVGDKVKIKKNQGQELSDQIGVVVKCDQKNDSYEIKFDHTIPEPFNTNKIILHSHAFDKVVDEQKKEDEKFKVGDKVKVKRVKSIDKLLWGKEGVVIEITPTNNYLIKFDEKLPDPYGIESLIPQKYLKRPDEPIPTSKYQIGDRVEFYDELSKSVKEGDIVNFQNDRYQINTPSSCFATEDFIIKKIEKFKVGDRVEIFGVISEPKYNGEFGEVVSIEGLNAYKIKLDKKLTYNYLTVIRGENIRKTEQTKYKVGDIVEFNANMMAGALSKHKYTGKITSIIDNTYYIYIDMSATKGTFKVPEDDIIRKIELPKEKTENKTDYKVGDIIKFLAFNKEEKGTILEIISDTEIDVMVRRSSSGSQMFTISKSQIIEKVDDTEDTKKEESSEEINIGDYVVPIDFEGMNPTTKTFFKKKDEKFKVIDATKKTIKVEGSAAKLFKNRFKKVDPPTEGEKKELEGYKEGDRVEFLNYEGKTFTGTINKIMHSTSTHPYNIISDNTKINYYIPLKDMIRKIGKYSIGDTVEFRGPGGNMVGKIDIITDKQYRIDVSGTSSNQTYWRSELEIIKKVEESDEYSVGDWVNFKLTSGMVTSPKMGRIIRKPIKSNPQYVIEYDDDKTAYVFEISITGKVGKKPKEKEVNYYVTDEIEFLSADGTKKEGRITMLPTSSRITYEVLLRGTANSFVYIVKDKILRKISPETKTTTTTTKNEENYKIGDEVKFYSGAQIKKGKITALPIGYHGTFTIKEKNTSSSFYPSKDKIISKILKDYSEGDVILYVSNLNNAEESIILKNNSDGTFDVTRSGDTNTVMTISRKDILGKIENSTPITEKDPIEGDYVKAIDVTKMTPRISTYLSSKDFHKIRKVFKDHVEIEGLTGKFEKKRFEKANLKVIVDELNVGDFVEPIDLTGLELTYKRFLKSKPYFKIVEINEYDALRLDGDDDTNFYLRKRFAKVYPKINKEEKKEEVSDDVIREGDTVEVVDFEGVNDLDAVFLKSKLFHIVDFVDGHHIKVDGNGTQFLKSRFKKINKKEKKDITKLKKGDKIKYAGDFNTNLVKGSTYTIENVIKVSPTDFGVDTKSDMYYEKGYGVCIGEVTGLAVVLGLKKNDILRSIGNPSTINMIYGLSDIKKAMNKILPGQEITVKYQRPMESYLEKETSFILPKTTQDYIKLEDKLGYYCLADFNVVKKTGEKTELKTGDKAVVIGNYSQPETGEIVTITGVKDANNYNIQTSDGSIYWMAKKDLKYHEGEKTKKEECKPDKNGFCVGDIIVGVGTSDDVYIEGKYGRIMDISHKNTLPYAICFSNNFSTRLIRIGGLIPFAQGLWVNAKDIKKANSSKNKKIKDVIEKDIWVGDYVKIDPEKGYHIDTGKYATVKEINLDSTSAYLNATVELEGRTYSSTILYEYLVKAEKSEKTKTVTKEKEKDYIEYPSERIEVGNYVLIKPGKDLEDIYNTIKDESVLDKFKKQSYFKVTSRDTSNMLTFEGFPGIEVNAWKCNKIVPKVLDEPLNKEDIKEVASENEPEKKKFIEDNMDKFWISKYFDLAKVTSIKESEKVENGFDVFYGKISVDDTTKKKFVSRGAEAFTKNYDIVTSGLTEEIKNELKHIDDDKEKDIKKLNRKYRNLQELATLNSKKLKEDKLKEMKELISEYEGYVSYFYDLLNTVKYGESSYF